MLRNIIIFHLKILEERSKLNLKLAEGRKYKIVLKINRALGVIRKQ